jgi:hypothetical protein
MIRGESPIPIASMLCGISSAARRARRSLGLAGDIGGVSARDNAGHPGEENGRAPDGIACANNACARRNADVMLHGLEG